ncbi:PEPxxWA-CTERM sorting domain-containing protein [Sphingomonas endolithica]|uniref:PEPxxWA-CTERM sorting domain-containing protein n=1 Tax=Sphingomonas endolithica TaxID=2972485 RepID=UPI0021AF0702|nr:PEPxxWA-CTERM sorting domain-containing protein [Sphingomonas sp. ZFBP2030]
MKMVFLAAAAAIAFGASSAHAGTVSNPNGGSNVGPLCGWPYQGGACQTVFIGESFAAPNTGSLTNLQFGLLDGSTLTSVQAIVYALNGPLASTFTPGAEIWRSAAVAGTSGVLDFNPTGVTLTGGQNYVAFLSTYYSIGTGQANVASCNPFTSSTCAVSNTNPSLGRAIIGSARGANLDELTFAQVVNGSQDLTFSATIAAVPEPATWGMMIVGFGLAGTALRRKRKVSTRLHLA